MPVTEWHRRHFKTPATLVFRVPAHNDLVIGERVRDVSPVDTRLAALRPARYSLYPGQEMVQVLAGTRLWLITGGVQL